MRLLLVFLLAVPVFGQFGAASRIISGTGAPVSAQCTVENNVGLVWARKDGADSGTTFYVCGATGVGTYGWELRGGAPGGGSSLTTVGAVPFVTSAGVLGQDATNLFWDNANGRLGVGTNGPLAPLDVSAQLFLANVSALPTDKDSYVGIMRTAGAGSFPFDNAGSLLLRPRVSSTAGRGSILFYSGSPSTEKARITESGNLLLGTTTDANFRLNVGSSGSSGTAQFYDATATTGVTQVVVRAGAGQSTTQLVRVRNNADSFNLLSIESTGRVISDVGYDSRSDAFSYAASAAFSSGGRVTFGPSSTVYYNPDLALSRASAGVLQVGDGGANALGVVNALRFTWGNGTEATCNATQRGQVVMVQGGAGVADTFRICRKDAADVYAWTALY